MTKIESIHSLVSAGFALIPLRGKKPATIGWDKTAPGAFTEKQLARGNYGVVLGPEDLVIDVDPRNFAPGDAPARRLATDAGLDAIASTFIVRTGGGGLHVYLKKPSGLSTRDKHPIYRGIEFKSGPGRQVVGPGSVHPDTNKPYEVQSGAPSGILSAPEKLLILISRPTSSAAQSSFGTQEYKDDASTRERFQDYLRLDAKPSIEGEQGDANAFRVACRGRDLGLSPNVALEAMLSEWNPRCQPSWSDEDLREKVQNAYKYANGSIGSAHPAAVFSPIPAEEDRSPEVGASGWKLNGKKEPTKCFQNLLNYFSLRKVGLKGIFGYNEFARRVEFLDAPPWVAVVGSAVQDVDLQRMRAHLARQHGYEAGKDDLVDAMVDVAQARRFHPVKDYLSSLTWDGIARLDSWLLKYLGAHGDDEGYICAVGRKTLCAAVARVFDPGCKFDHVLVLEGPQNIGKSGVCRILGGKWFADFRLSVENKDTVQMMQGKWIVEMAELHMVRQVDTDALKAFLTRQVDEARFAYGRLPGEYPRQGVFIATYNPKSDGTYLKDETGNRRWWPVQCAGVPPGTRHFDFAGLMAARDQLFAEAVVYYRAGERLTMDTNELREAAVKAQAERRAEHPWVQRVREWMDMQEHKDFYTAREIFVGAMCGLDARFGRREALDVAAVMRDLGFERGYMKDEKERTTRGYWRSKVDERPLDIWGGMV